TVLFALVAVLAAVLLTRAISRPLTALASAADAIARGDLHAKVEVPTHDEIGRLAQSFNAMVESLTRSRAAPEEKVVELERANRPMFETDRVKLREIVHNLVDNAVKFTEAGRVAVVAHAGKGPGWVVIEVSDTGPGIPAEDLDTVFDAFHQVGESSTRRTGGVGLGLSIVKQLVTALGGTVSVTS